MGGRMAGRLLDAGHDVLVWNRSPERLVPLAERWAVAVRAPSEAAARADVLITSVADAAALRAVVEGPDGIAAAAGPRLTVVEMSTVGPAAIERLASVLPPETGLLDAPVLGSIAEAEQGSLTIFVGGPEALVELVAPVLGTLGSVVHVGPLGAGAAAKLVANAALLGTLVTLGETLALAQALGLSEDAAYEALAATPLAAQAARRRGAIDDGRYAPRFRLALARKDAELIRAAAAGSRLDLRTLEAVRTRFADAETTGWGDRDYTAVLATILGGKRRPAGGPPTAYDGLVVDLDGVVWLGGEPIEGAAEAIEHLRASGVRIVFLTNDPQSSRAEYAARLGRIGIPASEDDVVTSSAATARFLRAQERLAGSRALVIGSAALRDEIARAGFPIVATRDAARAELVVVGGHEGFDYGELRAATTALRGGAELFATGRDAVFPTRDGPRPATGAILSAVETAAGVVATVVGKPEPFVFQIARDALAGCERVAVVGDHLIADVAGAKRAGLDAILVLTGATTADELERAAIRPDLVLSSLADLRASP
jgi:HAD superfamily hydrolase (TIGR01450 family)